MGRTSLACYTLQVFLALIHGRAFSTQPNGVNKPSLSMHESTAGFSNHFKIERVVTKKRALDVQIFRRFTVTPAEYIQKVKEGAIDGEEILISEEEAIDQLMLGYDDRGNYVKNASSKHHEIYFVAVHNGYEELENDKSFHDYSRQNGVIGVVRVQIAKQGGSSAIDQYKSASSMKGLPPHAHLSNLIVDETQRRRGVGTALLSAVSSYIKSKEDINLVILSVDSDNVGAIQMYKKNGYEFLDQDDVSGTMFLRVEI